jgi:hypothetical protein
MEGVTMAVIIRQTMPPEASLEMMDAVSKEMGVDEEPPPGLILHTHYEEDGHVHVMDVWESAAAHRTFAEQRIGPAVRAVSERHGVTAAAAPEMSVTEIHSLVRGR